MSFLGSFIICCFSLIMGNSLYAQSPESSLTVASFSADDSTPNELSLFTDNLLSTNADVLCFQEQFDDSSITFLYENLKECYPYFYFAPSSVSHPLFVASKYPIEYSHFTPIFQDLKESGVLFDGGIIRNGCLISHFYVAHLDPKAEKNELNSIVQKMEEDCIALGDDKLPYFLCSEGKGGSVQLLRTLHSYPQQEVSQGGIVASFPFSFFSQPHVKGLFAKLSQKEENELPLLLCKTGMSASASAGRDKDGSDYLNAGASLKWKSDDGEKEVTFEAKGGVSKEPHGEMEKSGSVTAGISRNF